MTARSILTKVLLGATLLTVLGAAPASADPAGPSDFRSEVTRIVPTVPGVTADIRGGDTYLEIHVAKGHEVVVRDYSVPVGDPYVRVLKDGTVERNRHSPAAYLNNNRQGKGTVPPEAHQGATPLWEKVGSGGHYAWHDHRVHWMGDVSPPVPRGQRVTGAYAPWHVPIEADGTAAQIEGTLTYEKAMSPLPWALAGLAGAGLLAWFGRRHAVRSAAGALLVVGVSATVVGRADFSANPGGGNPLLWILPAVGVIAAAVAVVRSTKGSAVVGVLAAVATLSSWALLRYEVLLKPVIPTHLAPGVDRTTVALAFGVAVASAYLAVTSGGLRLPDLEDD
jgi:hypothetical protein